MQINHIPKIEKRYWTALIFASIFGANTGDFFADVLKLGHVSGLPVLAVLFTVFIVIEKFDSIKHQFYFWTTIIIVRTAATNMGDIGHDLKINPKLVLAIWTMALILTVFVWRIYDTKKNKGTFTKNSSLFAIKPIYWFVMFLAGTLGTVLGDYSSYVLKLGNLNAALILGAILLIIFFIGRNGLQTNLSYYWLTIVIIRSAGTAAGDFIAHNIGLSLSTLISGIVFVILLLVWKEKVSSTIGTLQESKEPSVL